MEGKFNALRLVLLMMWCSWGCWSSTEGSYIDSSDEKSSNTAAAKTNTTSLRKISTTFYLASRNITSKEVAALREIQITTIVRLSGKRIIGSTIWIAWKWIVWSWKWIVWSTLWISWVWRVRTSTTTIRIVSAISCVVCVRNTSTRKALEPNTRF